MSRNITDELIALLAREMKLDPAGLTPKTPIFEGGLELDSFAVVAMVTQIEQHFGMQLSDDDFRPENFADIKTLAGVVGGYMPSQPAA